MYRDTVRAISMMSGLTLVVGVLLAAAVSAHTIGHSAFQREWDRHDRAVAEGMATRSWMWGPDAYTDVLEEDYVESPGGQRQVQYFDKSRMEITYPGTDDQERWYVSNGLLVVELITGNMQLGDTEFEPGDPARVNVAGDPETTIGPTYASFTEHLNDPAFGTGDTLNQQLHRNGDIEYQPSFGTYGITAGALTDATDHRTASIFEEFFSRTGPLWIDGDWQTGQIAGVYEVGLPITEAYWADVVVDGTQRDVLVQCFERRCLTYTPDNAPEWQVEMGNVGQHYYRWRYGDGSSDDLEGGVLATFDVDGEVFRVWVTNPDTIQQLVDLRDGTSTANIPNGRIHYGPGQGNHNDPWSWHLDPEDISMADVTIELCDARPSYVEEQVQEFVEVVGRYCSWGAELVSLEDFRDS